MNAGHASTGLQPNKFKKGPNAEIKGTSFQIHNTALCLLQASVKLDDWKLSSENELAGKFDDVVVEWKDGAHPMQTKYKHDRKIEFDQLFSKDSLNNFNLVDYFLSYLDIRSKFQVTNVSICTNATVWANDNEKRLLKPQNATFDNILYLQGQECSYYMLDKAFVSAFKARANDYLHSKKIAGRIITDSDVEDFFQCFRIYYNHPCGRNLRYVLEHLLPRVRLQRNIFNKMSVQDIISKVTEWYKRPRGKCEYLTELQVRNWGTQTSAPIVQTSTFTKSGDIGIPSMMFHINLIAICYLKALQKFNNWGLSFKNKLFGKFDKIVLELPGEIFVIQPNYKEHNVSFDKFLSTSLKNNSFSLPKLFLQYQEIKKFGADVNIIICTNVDVTVDTNRQKLLNSQIATSNSILYSQGCDLLLYYYTFDEAIIPILKKNVKRLLENLKTAETYTGMVTDDELKDFLNHLELYYNYPCDLEDVIEELLPPIKICKRISAQNIIGKVMEWFEEEGECEYLTKAYAKTMFAEIISDKYCETLDQYNVLFEHNDLDFDDTKKILHFTFENGYLLHTIKIFRILQYNRIQALYVDPYEDVGVQLQVIEAFDDPRYNYLIITWPEIPPPYVIVKVYKKLRGTLKKYDYKKVVLVAKTLINHLRISDDFYQIINTHVSIHHFIKETQIDLLKRETIIFNEKVTSLREIMRSNKSMVIRVCTKILDKVVRDEEVVAKVNLYSVNINGVDEKVIVLTADDSEKETIFTDFDLEKSVAAIKLLN